MSLKHCPRCDARFRGDIVTCPIDGTVLREPDDPFIDRVIAGRYLVEEQLGAGGMGSVYRARHQIIGRDVALKFLEPSLIKNERQRKRFLGEARAANQIAHEHIIDITDFGETEDGLVYMVMEYLQGRTLSDDIDDGPLVPRRALRIATQVALGLARAHELGVVHRDIKPANIYLVRRKADPDYVKILDFGVARIEQDMRITGQGTIVGTPEYIAPEQIRSGSASAPADLYSLGCVLFEMLTGQLPFTGKTTMLLVKHLNDPVPVPSSVNSSVPPEVDAVVVRLMAKNPGDRYRDAYHLVEVLQDLLDRLPPLLRYTGKDNSVRDSAETTPSVPAPSEEASFARTVELYRSLIDEAHPEGEPPSWLPEAVAYLENTIAEVRVLRQRLRGVAEKATEQEENCRGPRTLIGRALDELAQDDSRLGRRVDLLVAELEGVQARLDQELDEIVESSRAFPRRPVEGYVLSEIDATAIGRCSDAVQRLANARQRERELGAGLSRHRLEHQDLRFQITELKDQLSSLNAASTIDQQIVHDEVHRVSAQIQAKLEAMAPYAARVSAHFHQFPALHERLSLPPATTH